MLVGIVPVVMVVTMDDHGRPITEVVDLRSDHSVTIDRGDVVVGPDLHRFNDRGAGRKSYQKCQDCNCFLHAGYLATI